MDNPNQTPNQESHQNSHQSPQQEIQAILNLFQVQLNQALQQNNSTLFNVSVGTLLKLSDLMFQPNPPNQTDLQHTTKEESQ